MCGRIQVNWERDGCPFFLLIKQFTAQAAKRWKGEPTEALGYVWISLRLDYPNGRVLDPREIVGLGRFVERKVSNFYRNEKPFAARGGLASLGGADQAEPVKPKFPPPRFLLPEREAENRELSAAIEAAFDGLVPRRGAAARSSLKYHDAPTALELARRWDTSPQNVYQQAKKATEELRNSLARFDRGRLELPTAS